MGKNIKEVGFLTVVIYVALKINSMITTSICFIRGITGIPCPACGITRAYSSLLKGQILQAVYFHPLLLAPIPVIVIYIFKKEKFEKCIKIVGTIAIIVYIIRMIIMFPNVEPMKFNKNGIIPRIIMKIIG